MRQSGRRTLIRTLAMAFALAVAGLAPAVASALSVTFNPAGNGTYEIHLDDNAGVVNQVALTTVTPSGGMPDLVIGDVTAGIMDPFPSCQRVDPTIIRCPP